MSRWLGRFAAAATALLVVQSPRMAAACAVCMGGQEEESQFAFILMTVFMSTLPLAMIGGLVWFIRRAYRQREAQTQSRLAGLAPGARSPH